MKFIHKRLFVQTFILSSFIIGTSNFSDAANLDRRPANFWSSLKKSFSASGQPSNPTPANLVPTPATHAATIPLPGKNRIIIFGGSGDVMGMPYYTGQENSFRDNYVNLIQTFRKAGWEARALFEGDIAHCKQYHNCPANLDPTWDLTPIAQALGTDVNSIPRGSKAALLTELDNALQDLSSGDQLLLYIETHGEGNPVANQFYWSHQIVISSDQEGQPFTNIPGAEKSYAGTMAVEDADLQGRLQKLKSAGIKLAFIDGSCFGGGSIPAFSQYGCTLSATNSKTVFSSSGADPLSGSVMDAMNGNFSIANSGQVTFEEAYLKTLANYAGAEISADPAETEASETLRDLEFRFTHDLLYVPSASAFNTCQNCSKDSPQAFEDYLNQFMASPIDDAQNSNYFNLVSHFSTASRSTTPVVDARTTQSQIAGMPSAWANIANQYNTFDAAKSSAMADLQSLANGPQWDFSGDLSPYQDLFNQAVTNPNHATSYDLYPMPNGSFWLVYNKAPITPKDSQFNQITLMVAGDFASDMNALSLQHSDYQNSLSANTQSEIANMILQSEMTLWNSLSSADQKRMTQDFANIQASITKEETLISSLDQSLESDMSLMKMYGHLILRDQQPSAQGFQDCGSFTLKRFQ